MVASVDERRAVVLASMEALQCERYERDLLAMKIKQIRENAERDINALQSQHTSAAIEREERLNYKLKVLDQEDKLRQRLAQVPVEELQEKAAKVGLTTQALGLPKAQLIDRIICILAQRQFLRSSAKKQKRRLRIVSKNISSHSMKKLPTLQEETDDLDNAPLVSDESSTSVLSSSSSSSSSDEEDATVENQHSPLKHHSAVHLMTSLPVLPVLHAPAIEIQAKNHVSIIREIPLSIFLAAVLPLFYTLLALLVAPRS